MNNLNAWQPITRTNNTHLEGITIPERTLARMSRILGTEEKTNLLIKMHLIGIAQSKLMEKFNPNRSYLLEPSALIVEPHPTSPFSRQYRVCLYGYLEDYLQAEVGEIIAPNTLAELLCLTEHSDATIHLEPNIKLRPQFDHRLIELIKNLPLNKAIKYFERI